MADETEDGKPRPPEPERTIRLDIYHHFEDGPIPVALTVDGTLDVDLAGTAEFNLAGGLSVTIVTPAIPRPTATHAILIVTDSQGATNMPGQITVDTDNEQALFAWLDDHGDTNASAPSNDSGNAVVTFASDNPSVATVDPASGAITPVAEGTADISATIAYPDGSEVFEADGVTPFPAPDPATVTVGPGAAVGDALTLSV